MCVTLIRPTYCVCGRVRLCMCKNNIGLLKMHSRQDSSNQSKQIRPILNKTTAEYINTSTRTTSIRFKIPGLHHTLPQNSDVEQLARIQQYNVIAKVLDY